MKDLTNQTFERLTAIKPVGKDKSGNYKWECKCECGSCTVVSSGDLSSGNTKSCGCLKKEKARLNRMSDYGQASFNSLYSSYKKSANKRRYKFILSEKTFRELTSSNCYYCGIEPSQIYDNGTNGNGNYVYNGIDRVNNDVGYLKKNCVPCCKDCNRAKRTMTQEEFLSLIKRIHKNLKL